MHIGVKFQHSMMQLIEIESGALIDQGEVKEVPRGAICRRDPWGFLPRLVVLSV